MTMCLRRLCVCLALCVCVWPAEDLRTTFFCFAGFGSREVRHSTAVLSKPMPCRAHTKKLTSTGECLAESVCLVVSLREASGMPLL